MFSKELKELIEASLVDGVLTEKEKTVIKKRAMNEGIDPDEIDVLLDSEVEKIRRKSQENVAKVKKCPNCGATIGSLLIRCPECGYEFQDNKVVSSINSLYESLSKTDDLSKQKRIIKNFPVPNNREDIIEFLGMGVANCKKTGGFLGSAINRFLIIFIPLLLFDAWLLYKMLSTHNDDNAVLWGMGLIYATIGGLIGAIYFAIKGIPEEKKKLNENQNELASAWREKMKQVIFKAKIVLKSPDDLKMIKDVEKRIK